MKYEFINGREWLPSHWHAGADQLWAEPDCNYFQRQIRVLATERQPWQNKASDCFREREREEFHQLLQSLRISRPMTDVLLRGVALAIMLLACSHVSDVLVRCPAVELMVLVCWAFRGMQSVRLWWMSVTLRRPASLLIRRAVSCLSGRAQLAPKSESA